MTVLKFRVRWRRAGAHVHCRVFQSNVNGSTWQKNGDLVFDEAGWAQFRLDALRSSVDVIPEDE